MAVVLLLLAGIVGWILYQGPVPFAFGRQSATLHGAVATGNMKDARSFIEEDRGLIESRDSHGELPIHFAIKYGQMEALKLLIDEGADVDGQASRTDDTGLHYAVMMGDEAAVSLLLASGADPFVKNADGQTPLDSAREHTYSHVDRIIELLENAQAEAEENGLSDKPVKGDTTDRAP